MLHILHRHHSQPMVRHERLGLSKLNAVQDGNIAESVVWQCSPSERHHIVDHVMLHALQRHLGSDCAVTGHASLLDAAMLQRGSHLDEQATARRSAHHHCTTGSFWQLYHAII